MTQRLRPNRPLANALAGAVSLGALALAPTARAQSPSFTDFVDQRLDLTQTALSACDTSQPAAQRPTEPVRLEIAYTGRRISVTATGAGVAAGWRRCVEEAVLAAVPVAAAESVGVPRQAARVFVTVSLGAPSVTTAPAPSAPYAVGQRVTVQWGASWYPASVVRVDGPDRFLIHYDGWSTNSDEVVGLDRIRVRDGEAPPPPPQPTVTPGTPARFAVERPAEVAPPTPPTPPTPPPPPVLVNLVANGGFEGRALRDGTWATGGIPGWRTASGPGGEVQANAAGAPAEGRQLVELDSDAPSAIAQDLATRAGQRYELSLSFSARPGTARVSNRLAIVWGGQVVARIDSDGNGTPQTRWVTVTQIVTASSSRTTLELRDEGAADGLGTYVDDVRVTPIP